MDTLTTGHRNFVRNVITAALNAQIKTLAPNVILPLKELTTD